MNSAKRARIGALVLAILVLVPATAVVAQTLTHQSTAGVTYETNSGVEVTLGDDREVQAVPFDDDSTFNDSNLRVSGSDATVEVDDNSFGSDPISVRNVDVTGSLTVERTDLNRQFTVESGDASLLQVRDYAADDGTDDFAYDSDGGFDLTLDGLGPVTVAAIDSSSGDELDRVDAGNDGQATFSLPSGSRNVELRSIYETDSGVSIRVEDDSRVPDDPFSGNDTFVAGDVTASGEDAAISLTEETYNDYPISVQNVDVTGSLTVERTDLNRQFTVESGDASLLQMRDYEVDNGEEDFAYDSDDGLTLTLDGFDPIGIAAVDAETGDPLDDAAVGVDGTATFELPPGQRSVRLEPTPSDLEVRNEANPSELIDGENVTLRARLFADDDVVIERQVTDGTVSLESVPPDEELVVTVKEANADYTYRRILIDSAIETSEIYLLPTTEPSAEVAFQLQDETGRFDSEDTRLFVEKPITRDFNGDGENTTRYETIAGDRVGADGQFPTILVDSERYRLRVENDEGEQRVLGSYTVQGAQISTIPIGEVEFSSDVSEGAALEASLREAADGAGHDHEVRLTYVDGDAETESIDISIENESGGAIRPETTENVTGSEAYVETFPIEDTSFDPEEDTAKVTVEAQRGTETETFEETLGDVPEIFTDAPIDSGLLELAGLISIVAVIGLLVIVNASLAALVGTGYAGLLTLVGVVSIPMPAVVLAGVVSVLASVGTKNGVLR